MKYNDPVEHPVVVQFRGSNLEQLVKATAIAASWGYDEVNINCGCPVAEVKGKETFGAAMMKDPSAVQALVNGLIQASSIPVTVKCRVGVDDLDSYEYFRGFVATVVEGGVKHVIVHARKALLKGLGVIGNRTIPPLKYEWVYQIAKEFPDVRFTINGGIKTLDAVLCHITIDEGGVERGQRVVRVHGGASGQRKPVDAGSGGQGDLRSGQSRTEQEGSRAEVRGVY